MLAFLLITVLDYDKNLVDREGFPREDLDFGKLTEYRLLKKRQNGNPKKF